MTPEQFANTPKAQQARQMLLAHGISPASLTLAQLASLAETRAHSRQKSITAYMAKMQQRHGKQIWPRS